MDVKREVALFCILFTFLKAHDIKYFMMYHEPNYELYGDNGMFDLELNKNTLHISKNITKFQFGKSSGSAHRYYKVYYKKGKLMRSELVRTTPYWPRSHTSLHPLEFEEIEILEKSYYDTEERLIREERYKEKEARYIVYKKDYAEFWTLINDNFISFKKFYYRKYKCSNEVPFSYGFWKCRKDLNLVYLEVDYNQQGLIDKFISYRREPFFLKISYNSSGKFLKALPTRYEKKVINNNAVVVPVVKKYKDLNLTDINRFIKNIEAKF